MLLICLIIIGFCALIGLPIGVVKGVSKCKTWATEILLAAVVTIILSHVYNFDSTIVNAIAVIGTAFASLLIFIIISAAVKKFFKKHWKPLGRIFGGITLAIKGATIACLIMLPILSIVELINVDAINEVFSGLFTSGLWVGVKPYIFDYLLVAIMMFLIREGYKTGISGVAWVLIRIGLFVGAEFLAYNLAFGSDVFIEAAENLAANVSFISSIGEATEGFSQSLNATFYAQCIMTVGLGILFAIVTGIICFIITRILDRAREGAVFKAIDGVLGLVFMFVVFTAILLVIGGLLGSLSELEFMSGLNEYLANDGIASVFYDKNPLMEISLFADLNLAQYFQ